jgi:hypothetical protein
MPRSPWCRGNGQAAAINHGRILSAPQPGHEPYLDGIHKVRPGLLNGRPLRQAARQIGRLGHDDVELLALLVDGVLEDLGKVVRETHRAGGFPAHARPSSSNGAIERVLTFAILSLCDGNPMDVPATAGKPMPSYQDKGVVFTLSRRPAKSRAASFYKTIRNVPVLPLLFLTCVHL